MEQHANTENAKSPVCELVSNARASDFTDIERSLIHLIAGYGRELETRLGR
jgi:hypothetical protein